MRNLIRASSLVLLGVVFSGCATPEKVIEPRWKSKVWDKSYHVDVTNVYEDYSESTGLTLGITFQSSAMARQTPRYRIEWRDAAGIPIASILGNWRDLSLAKDENYSVKVTAPNLKAVSYTIHLED